MTKQTTQPNLYSSEQDKLCTYNVTLRRVRVTTAAVEKKYILNIMCVSVFLPQVSGMQVVSFLHCTILSSHKRYDCPKKKIMNI